MKKNTMMRVASFLLIAVLITTSAISGTYAKYVTTATGSDTARVAKWGVTVTAQGDAFSKTYASETEGYSANTVISDVKVIAPGTTGTLADIKVEGTPEVAVEVTYVADLTLTGWALLDGTVYCPVVFKVEGTEYKIGDTYTTTADLETAVEGAIANCKKQYAANASIDTSSDAPTITWTWAYEAEDNSKDTYLGNQASIGNAPTITLTITTTATQID